MVEVEAKVMKSRLIKAKKDRKERLSNMVEGEDDRRYFLRKPPCARGACTIKSWIFLFFFSFFFFLH